MQRLMRQCAQLEIESSNITDGGHSLGQGDALVMIQHGAGLCCFQKLSFFFGSYLASFSCLQKYGCNVSSQCYGQLHRQAL